MGTHIQKGLLAFTLGLLTIAGCDLFETPEIDIPKKVFIRGTVAVPEGSTEYVVLSQSRWLAHEWWNCYKDGTNDSKKREDGKFILETANNCSSAQYLQFYVETPVDMSSYAQGVVKFKVQTNNAYQSLSFRVQDNNAVASNTLNLNAYGFNPNNVAIDQAISVPVTALTNGTALSLNQMKRLFQLDVSCNTDNCFTTISDIRWAPGGLPGASPYTPLARSGPRCDPGPCKGLPYANVGLIRTSPTGWTAVPADVTTTDADGNYSLIVDFEDIQGSGTLFVGASDAEGTFTLLSTIGAGRIKENADIDVDVDRSTTAVGMMVCPNGMTIPADGSGGWCIGDPVSTTELETLTTVVDESFDTTVSIDIEVFFDDVIDSPAVVTALNKLLGDHGLAAVTEAQLDAVAAAEINIPIVTAEPTNTNNNNTGGTYTGEKMCVDTLSCTGCSIKSCTNGTADNTCQGWYETSDGGRFACNACNDCTGAADAAIKHCGCDQQ